MNPRDDDTAHEDGDRDENGDVRTQLDDIDDGCGCAELWEELSEHRTNTDAE